MNSTPASTSTTADTTTESATAQLRQYARLQLADLFGKQFYDLNHAQRDALIADVLDIMRTEDMMSYRATRTLAERLGAEPGVLARYADTLLVGAAKGRKGRKGAANA